VSFVLDAGLWRISVETIQEFNSSESLSCKNFNRAHIVVELTSICLLASNSVFNLSSRVEEKQGFAIVLVHAAVISIALTAWQNRPSATPMLPGSNETIKGTETANFRRSDEPEDSKNEPNTASSWNRIELK
jgi:hypothetical protein